MQLTVVPTVVRSGEAFNVVPGRRRAVFDARASDMRAFERVLAAVPEEIGGVDARAGHGARLAGDGLGGGGRAAACAPPLSCSGGRSSPRARGGASDASHFAVMIPLTIDGLGPRGGGAHTPEEFVHEGSLTARIAVALAVARAAILSV